MQERNLHIPTSGAAPKRANRHSSNGNDIPLEETFLHQAWDLYYNVFKRINAQMPHVTSLELQYCSPALMQARDLEIGVPGTYR